MIPLLQSVFGEDAVVTVPPQTVAEDFAYYQQTVPACSSIWDHTSDADATEGGTESLATLLRG